MTQITFKAGSIIVVTETKKKEPNFALLAKFEGVYRVVSIHKRKELANPLDVHNDNLTDIVVAERV